MGCDYILYWSSSSASYNKAVVHDVDNDDMRVYWNRFCSDWCNKFHVLEQFMLYEYMYYIFSYIYKGAEIEFEL